MVEDKLLVWKLKHGSKDALCQIYEKYKDELLALAMSLSNDKTAADDVVNDVFVSFAEFADKLQLRSNLKGYLASCVANRIRDIARAESQRSVKKDEAKFDISKSDDPEQLLILSEELQQIRRAMARLPYEQREVIIMRTQEGLRFKAIAKSQGAHISTVQSRYYQGLTKLRSILNGEMRK